MFGSWNYIYYKKFDAKFKVTGITNTLQAITAPDPIKKL
jgi:hypothetical protein